MSDFMINLLVPHLLVAFVVFFSSVVLMCLNNGNNRSDRSARISSFFWFKWCLVWEIPAVVALIKLVLRVRKDIRDVKNEELEEALTIVRREISRKNEEELREFDRLLYGKERF